MKRYSMSFAAANQHKPEHPERTARKGSNRNALDFDVVFQVWPNRPSMARSIRMQESAGAVEWKACVALSPGEGH